MLQERRRAPGQLWRVNPLFILSPVYEYSNLEFEHVPVEYSVYRAQYLCACVSGIREYLFNM